MHIDPRQIPTDLKEPTMDAGYPPDHDGLDVTEEGEQCIDCLRFGYDPHQDVCLLCGHGQLRDDYDNDSMADVIPEDWRGETW